MEIVLGGEGLIGAELVRTLKKRKRSVKSIDLKSGMDLRHLDERWFEGAERVWFLAWDTGGAKYLTNRTLQHQMYKNNCEIMARVFDLIEQKQVPFLFVTSQLAGQRSAYGMTKLVGETWSAHLGGKILRLWNVYGWETPDIRSHVITDFVLSGLQYRSVKCRTNGEEHRRFLYKSDCVDAMLQFAESDQIYADVAGEKWIKIKDLARLVGSLLGVDVVLGKEKGEELIVDPRIPLGGWHPSISLREGLIKVIAEAKQYLAHL